PPATARLCRPSAQPELSSDIRYGVALETRPQIEKELDGRQACRFLTKYSPVLARDDELRAVQGIADINADRPDRCCVTQPQTDGVRKIVQLIAAVLHALRRIETPRGVPRIRRLEDWIGWRPAEGYSRQPAIGVASVVEERASEARAHKGQFERKPQFLIEDHDRLAPNRKTRVRVAGPCLIQGNASQRGSAARKEALRQRDDLRERRRSRRRKS